MSTTKGRPSPGPASSGSHERSTAAASSRDYRIDFMRGIALIMIFINHIPGNVMGNFTSRNIGMSDSAEIFVLLAGFAAASAYYQRFAGGYALATSVRVFRRAGLLYTAHILCTMLALALFSAATLVLSEPELIRKINILMVIQDPVRSFVGIVTLSHQLGFFNILPLYIVLLVTLPITMSGYRHDWRLLLAGSVALYLIAITWRLTLPSYPGEDTWFFNPLAWQLLFIIGFIWGVRIKAGEAIPYHPVVFWCACLYAALAFIWVQVSIWDLFPKSLMANPLWSISKTYLSPLRLLHVLALAYVIGMSPVAGWLKRIPVTNFVVQMGQHALPVFCAGSLLSMALLIAREKFGGGILVDVSIVAIGVALQAVLAWFLAWQARSPAGQVGSAAAGGFMAGPPAVMPPPLPPLSR